MKLAFIYYFRFMKLTLQLLKAMLTEKTWSQLILLQTTNIEHIGWFATGYPDCYMVFTKIGLGGDTLSLIFVLLLFG